MAKHLFPKWLIVEVSKLKSLNFSGRVHLFIWILSLLSSGILFYKTIPESEFGYSAVIATLTLLQQVLIMMQSLGAEITPHNEEVILNKWYERKYEKSIRRFLFISLLFSAGILTDFLSHWINNDVSRTSSSFNNYIVIPIGQPGFLLTINIEKIKSIFCNLFSPSGNKYHLIFIIGAISAFLCQLSWNLNAFIYCFDQIKENIFNKIVIGGRVLSYAISAFLGIIYLCSLLLSGEVIKAVSSYIIGFYMLFVLSSITLSITSFTASLQK